MSDQDRQENITLISEILMDISNGVDYGSSLGNTLTALTTLLAETTDEKELTLLTSAREQIACQAEIQRLEEVIALRQDELLIHKRKRLRPMELDRLATAVGELAKD